MDIIKHEVNNTPVEQRIVDGFINGTAMCQSHDKNMRDWFRLESTPEVFSVLSEELGINSKRVSDPLSGTAKLSVSHYVKAYPELVTLKKGSPINGGGTWLHPDLAIQLAQWCSPRFAIQVSRWVREWMTTGKNPVQSSQPEPPTQSKRLRPELPVIMPTPEQIEFMKSHKARSHPNWQQQSGYDKVFEAVRQWREESENLLIEGEES